MENLENIKIGDVIEFYTCSNADRKILRGQVENHRGLGLITVVDGVQHELKKLLEIKVIDTNRLFAEFMGYNVINYKGQPTYDGNKYAKTIGELMNLWNGLDLEFTGRFCKDVNYPLGSDWKYIMPIVERIERIGASVLIGRMFCEIEYQNPLNQKEHFKVRIASGVKINAVNGAVVDFIIWWFNNQKGVSNV